ncbi:MAG: diguanylate cyclase [Chloroflexota bacterium]|nr:MAG: diguanylate cyclase [Chloroflexota bacterium]
MTLRPDIGKSHFGPFGARTLLVVVVLAALAIIAGSTVVSQVTDQMRREADARQDRRAEDVATTLAGIVGSASSDIRLARRNEVFETALVDTPGQLLAEDRQRVESAITYLGDRYKVDEICFIRSSGLELARWVGGKGIAPVEDLSLDERQNNPTVLPTLPLADDAFYESSPYVSPDSGRWVIGIATPVVLASGDHAGILHFEIPVAGLAEAVTSAAYGATGFNVLLDRGGRVLVHPHLAEFRTAAGTVADPATGPFPLAVAAGSTSWRDAATVMLAGQAGSTTFNQDGVTYRLSYRPVANSDRVVGVASPLGELYADVDRLLLNLAITVGPLLLLMIILTIGFARSSSRASRGLAALNERLMGTNARLEESSRSNAELAGESKIINQFTELTALTEDDVSLSVATLATMDELLHPNAAALHVSNRSQDRAVPQATLGERATDVLSLHELERCPALRRSSLYITNDVAARLSFRCPVYPVESGTLACVPLVALGEVVGAIHLHWDEPRELSLPLRLAITRVSEHAALSIANRRLLLALRGQANTDGRTGLTNSRAFDELLERRLADRGDSERLAVLMLDLDRFKDFNDRYGHPAGDEALRTFAHILSSSVRDNDVAARYGGEEFALYLPGLDANGAREVAERIRERTEATIIPLGPGSTGRITVSIGIAAAPNDGIERMALLKAADEALYRAKQAGRNRVVVQRGWVTDAQTTEPVADPEPRAASA